MTDPTGINPGDLLSFWGSLVGALSGVATAFLAVYLQRHVSAKDAKRTLRGLIDELENSSNLLKADAATRPAEAVRRAHRAFTALRDTSLAIRWTSFGCATLAARMEHTTVWPEIERLRRADGAVQVPDATARGDELIALCSELRDYLGDSK